MKIFISYSRDDKAWVYELWRALRDRGFHDAWIDQRIIPAQDWWNTILDEIEAAEVFIYVMTPKSVESIYCAAELAHALTCNKPILPLMLKPCDAPPEITRRRIQYAPLRDDMSLGDVLFTIERGLGDIRVALLQGQYRMPDPLPERPAEPEPVRKPEQVSEVFMMAEDAASQNNLTLAEKLFQQVKEADSGVYGRAAADRLGELRHERERDADYLNIVQMAANPAMRRGARALWRVFVEKYPGYDPQGVGAVLSAKEPPAETPSSSQTAVGSVSAEKTEPPPRTPPQSRPAPPPRTPPQPEPVSRVSVVRSLDLLPAPFAWIDIPAGKVKLEAGGYLKADTTFDVPAFSIARYPVTNAQFAKFVEADGYYERQWWTEDGWKVRAREGWAEPRFWTDSAWNGADQPVVGVSWYEAVAFCKWLSATTGERIMLPTEGQWQRAAQGDDGRAYPWGDEWDGARCNNSAGSNNRKVTTPVTQYEGKQKGDSFFGVTDMAGNVWEWCLTAYETGSESLEGTDRRVLRGGSWGSVNSHGFRCALRYGYFPPHWVDSRGFRNSRSSF